MKSEKDLFRYLKRACGTHNIGCYKLTAENVTGWPDMLLIHNGYSVFVELKSPSKTGCLSERQKLTHNKLRSHGATVYVSDSKETADAIIAHVINTRSKQRYR